jgi:hypothetical protein
MYEFVILIFCVECSLALRFGEVTCGIFPVNVLYMSLSLILLAW